jgi:protein TonB
LPVTVLTSDPAFASQIRAALETTSDVTVVSTDDEAAQLAVSGRCQILVTDAAITRKAIESLKARLRAHDPALVFIVAGSRDQGGMLIGLQSSGAADGFLLKPVTAGSTQLVVESATRRHRAFTASADSESEPTRARARVRTPRAQRSHSMSRADATALATPTVETHVPARTSQTITPLATTGVQAPKRAVLRPSWPLMIAAVAAVGGIVWWVMWQRLPDIDPQRVIAQYLSLADSAQRAGRWSGARDSAEHHYQTVLALDPQNLAAQRGIDRVAAELSRQTQALLSQKRLAEAAASLERLREMQPDYAELPLLDSQLKVLQDSVLAILTPAPVAESAPPQRAETPAETPSPARQRTASRAPIADRVGQPPETQKPAATAPAAIEAKPIATLASNTLPSAPAMVKPQPTAPTPTPAPTSSSAPTILKYVPPVYPHEAYARGIEGWVQVSLQVTPGGSVVNARIEDGEKRQLFSRAALAAVKQWKYEARPQATGETPVTVRLDFQLER